MTEYNIFCYSEEYDDENSFQQKRYRAFNQEVGEKRYAEIKKEVSAILKDFKLELNENSWSKEWEKVTQEQWQALLNIPEAQDYKKGFEFISGIKININDEVEKAIQLLEEKGVLKDGKVLIR